MGQAIKIKVGHWRFQASTKEFVFRSQRYQYEVDCERMSVNDWLCHLGESKALMSVDDVADLETAFAALKAQAPSLPVFTQKDEPHVAHIMANGGWRRRALEMRSP